MPGTRTTGAHLQPLRQDPRLHGRRRHQEWCLVWGYMGVSRRFTREAQQASAAAFDEVADGAVRTRPRLRPVADLSTVDTPAHDTNDGSETPGLLDRPAELQGDRRGFVL